MQSQQRLLPASLRLSQCHGGKALPMLHTVLTDYLIKKHSMISFTLSQDPLPLSKAMALLSTGGAHPGITMVAAWSNVSVALAPRNSKTKVNLY